MTAESRHRPGSGFTRAEIIRHGFTKDRHGFFPVLHFIPGRGKLPGMFSEIPQSGTANGQDNHPAAPLIAKAAPVRKTSFRQG